MRRSGLVCAAAAMALSASPPALAQSHPQSSDPQTQDLRCVVVALQLLNSATEAEKSAGLVATMYFVGKLDGRTPGLDFEKAIIAQVEAMKSGDSKSEAERCGKELQVRGKSLESIGDALTKKGY